MPRAMEPSPDAAGRGGNELRLLEEQVRSINRFPDQNPNPVLRMTPQGELLYANPASAPIRRALGAEVGGTLSEPMLDRLLSAARAGRRQTVEVEHDDQTYSLLAVDVPDLGFINIYGTDITAERVVAKFPDENPNPVLRVSPDGQLVYHNTASAPIVAALGLVLGRPVPGALMASVDRCLADASAGPIEQAADDLVFELKPVLVREFDFINIYGTDVTAARQLADAHATNQRLLLNILPKPIADRLLAGETVIADRFDEVTLLFADIVDFTGMSSRMSANEVVAFLNEVFSLSDELADRYGLEKIKTVGDAYMVVGGLPERSDDHAARVAEMALQLSARLGKLHPPARRQVAMRMGIHSGPAVAGVIGTRKFIYDVWGDTVNTASRMESHGVPGRIQVTRPVVSGLKGKYRFEPRGTIEVKGKGPMETWFLLGREGQG